jgi:hypothetical protein
MRVPREAAPRGMEMGIHGSDGASPSRPKGKLSPGDTRHLRNRPMEKPIGPVPQSRDLTPPAR